MDVAKDSKNAEAAAKFLDFMMSTPVQKETLGTFSTQSVNKEVKPTETDELRSFRMGFVIGLPLAAGAVLVLGASLAVILAKRVVLARAARTVRVHAVLPSSLHKVACAASVRPTTFIALSTAWPITV